MILGWLLLGGFAIWALIRLGRQSDKAGRGHWRVSATVLAAAAWGGAALLALRGSWIIAGALAAAGLWLAVASRQRNVAPRAERMSDSDARAILGVAQDADATAIQAAYRRLMTRAHPDAGGTEGLAAKLNAARDRLLRPTGRA